MRSRLLGVLALGFLSGLAWGQGIEAGAASGPWSDGQAALAHWVDATLAPVQGGIVDASVPSQRGLISWGAFSSRAAWLGWTLPTPLGSTDLAAGGLVPGTLDLHWDSYEFQAVFRSAGAFRVEHRWGPLTLGGGALEFAGRVDSSGYDLGPLRGAAWGLWAGTLGWAAFYGHWDGAFGATHNELGLWSVDAQGESTAQLGGLSFGSQGDFGAGTWSETGLLVAAEFRSGLAARWSNLASLYPLLYDHFVASGAVDGRLVGLWTDQSWRISGWTWGCGVGAGLLWDESAPWSRIHNWTQVTWVFPPFLYNTAPQTSVTNWALTAGPAWGLVFRPRVAWQPWAGLEVEVSRWLPLTGGWSFQQDDQAPQTASQGSSSMSDALTQTDGRNLWLAGTELKLVASW
jgi:hypothetical protein